MMLWKKFELFDVVMKKNRIVWWCCEKIRIVWWHYEKNSNCLMLWKKFEVTKSDYFGGRS